MRLIKVDDNWDLVIGPGMVTVHHKLEGKAHLLNIPAMVLKRAVEAAYEEEDEGDGEEVGQQGADLEAAGEGGGRRVELASVRAMHEAQRSHKLR